MLLKKIIENISKVIVGKDDVIKQVLTAFLSRGHILIEDVPGVGKTYLARSLALSIDTSFKRVQFTPDLLPSDITGVSIFNERNREFEFREGPVFADIFLGDELNRATPRTQSSLLESMEERQVTEDGKTYKLPDLFFVVATQNPIEQHGVYNLPEAQIDRFLMKISIGYAGFEDEVKILNLQRRKHPIEDLKSVAGKSEILSLQDKVKDVHIEKSLQEYIVSLTEATRIHKDVLLGGSARASLALFRASQALSLINGEEYVRPDTIKSLAKPVLRHRVILKPQSRLSGITSDEVVEQILNTVEVPIKT